LLHQIYNQLGFQDYSVVVLVFHKFDKSKTSLAYEQKIDSVHSLAPQLLAAQGLGHISGTTIRGFSYPPDESPCIPGILNDKVYALLYLLLGGYSIKG
jgi:hypothetical protein